MIVFLLSLTGVFANAQMACHALFDTPSYAQEYTEKHELRELYNDPGLRYEAERFIVNGIFSRNPEFANDFVSEFRHLLESTRLPDFQIYKKLREWLEPRQKTQDDVTTQGTLKRITRRATQIMSFFTSMPKRYLDVGAGDGSIAKALAKNWNLKRKDVMGLEVAQYSRETEMTWLKYGKDGRIPLKDGSIDAVSVLMVLHHVENQPQLVKEIFRVTAKGGTVVIRETDAPTPKSKLFNKILDEMYYSVFYPNPSVPTPALYRSTAEWVSLFKEVGFHVEVKENMEMGNPFTPVFFVLTKP